MTIFRLTYAALQSRILAAGANFESLKFPFPADDHSHGAVPMEHTKPTAPRRFDRDELATQDGIERRIRELTADFAAVPAGEREAVATEVEVLVAAAFMDPVAATPRGEMALSRALLAFRNSSYSEFKRVFSIGDWARDFDSAYDMAIDIMGTDVAFVLMEDVLIQTGEPDEAAMLVVERMVSPKSRYRKYARTPAAARRSDMHAVPAWAAPSRCTSRGRASCSPAPSRSRPAAGPLPRPWSDAASPSTPA
jgi:hypothetical protein